MAGHSKWANIKHRKAAQDAKRGKIFTKIIRELTVAARLGGGDPNDNPRLRAVVDKALTANMKKDTIERAIERGAGGGDDNNYEELTYEGYGPGGVAFFVEVMTDNKNRTVAEVRNAFNKSGGNLGTDGSVAYLFTKQGIISYGPEVDGDKLMEAALEAGAEDLQEQDDGSYEIVTTPEEYLDVKESLVNSGLKPDNSEVTMVPATRVDLDQEGAEKILKLIDTLEDLDDVQNVYHNAEISAEIMGSL
ncbi:YebC/PmpR family DNA-binding transcriptional regulator [Marinobacter persicus]|uniref:Probable transcriptional regulatory protein B0H24_100478 n=1 Tax=Marinobacter persicus TaxID=930118 RepID=A0A2S6G903_9GAMM|nr:YebC/PmpR family DNA-binding transcriptional regulator [Marinobacter persicus]PPK52778.1 YebC/PmpR family DNA-binding regulatory protein [Marinobacter persicus]PPK55676.1 YebC/PmpR family DNA-binding regulatory protein [Marinobacter persicus]PPK59289.1 YebC/PmpR family DNA-binding regulatory protein [Marinobacter persicus]